MLEKNGDINSPTMKLAKLASRLRYSDLPQKVIEQTKKVILDSVGCGLYGSKLPWGKIIADYVKDLGGNEKSTVWGNNFKTSAANASLSNGTMVHGFELDDLHKNSGVHGGSVIVTTALAIAEEKGDTNGKKLILAVVAGYEVCARIGTFMGVGLHSTKGFHPTGTVGALASAVTAGKILNLNEQQMAHCLGIGATQGAGLKAASYSAMVKRMHAGRAAQSGIYAAQLAQRGFTGITNVLESEYGGFCSTETVNMPDFKYLNQIINDKKYWILDVGYKPYSSCASTHTSIDAVGLIMNKHKITANMVKKIVVECTDLAKKTVGWEYKPESITGAQLNLSYCLAVKVIEGKAFVDQFTDEKIKDPKILKFIKENIEVVHNPELDKLGREGRHTIVMTLQTKKGKVYKKRIGYAKGSHVNPLTQNEIIEKFYYLTQQFAKKKKCKQLLDSIMMMDEIDDVKTLTEYLKV